MSRRPDGSWICGEPVAQCPFVCDCRFLPRRSLTLVLKKKKSIPFRIHSLEKKLKREYISDYNFHKRFVNYKITKEKMYKYLLKERQSKYVSLPENLP